MKMDERPGGRGARRARELRIMNSELRKKTAECGETCSAKRTHASRKPKAGRMKRRKVEKPKVQMQRRYESRTTNHGSRITNHTKPQWPNKPISSHAEGRDRDTMRIASRGVGHVAGRLERWGPLLPYLLRRRTMDCWLILMPLTAACRASRLGAYSMAVS